MDGGVELSARGLEESQVGILRSAVGSEDKQMNPRDLSELVLWVHMWSANHFSCNWLRPIVIGYLHNDAPDRNFGSSFGENRQNLANKALKIIRKKHSGNLQVVCKGHRSSRRCQALFKKLQTQLLGASLPCKSEKVWDPPEEVTEHFRNTLLQELGVSAKLWLVKGRCSDLRKVGGLIKQLEIDDELKQRYQKLTVPYFRCRHRFTQEDSSQVDDSVLQNCKGTCGNRPTGRPDSPSEIEKIRWLLNEILFTASWRDAFNDTDPPSLDNLKTLEWIEELPDPASSRCCGIW